MTDLNSAAPPAYGQWAALYRRFRPGYPPEVFAPLRAALGPAPGVCIELGAGSGQATMDLADVFRRVDALEPQAAMAALIPEHPRVRVRVGAAEDVEYPPESADAVVAAAAFHWMDQERVAERAADWLKPGGLFYAFGYAGACYPQAPAALTRVLADYARAWRRHVPERLSGWRPYAETLAACSVFASVQEFSLYAEHRWSAEALAGFLMSTSYGQSYARESGDADARMADLAQDLACATQGRTVRVRLPVEAALCRKRAAV